jgi:hypothetical protein
MSVKIVSVTSVLAACVAGAAIAFGPAASAEEPDDCALGGTAMVCNPPAFRRRRKGIPVVGAQAGRIIRTAPTGRRATLLRSGAVSRSSWHSRGDAA